MCVWGSVVTGWSYRLPDLLSRSVCFVRNVRPEIWLSLWCLCRIPFIFVFFIFQIPMPVHEKPSHYISFPRFSVSMILKHSNILAWAPAQEEQPAKSDRARRSGSDVCVNVCEWVWMYVLMCAHAHILILFFCGRAMEQRGTGVWGYQGRIWLVCTLPKTLWAGTTECPATERYISILDDQFTKLYWYFLKGHCSCTAYQAVMFIQSFVAILFQFHSLPVPSLMHLSDEVIISLPLSVSLSI